MILNTENMKTLKTNYDFIQQVFVSASPYSTILDSIAYVNNVCYSVSAALYIVYAWIWT